MKQATNPLLSASIGICGWINNRNACTFQSRSNGKVMWASGCDFYGNDIVNQAMLAQNCGDACSANGQCRHFSWSNGVCYMKKAVSSSATNCINMLLASVVTSARICMLDRRNVVTKEQKCRFSVDPRA